MRFIPAAAFTVVCSLMLVASPATTAVQIPPMLVRIAEIEIEPRYLTEYLAILQKEAAASVRLEPGVVSIFPMSEKAHPTRIRILEIYASRDAYETHLTSPHFLEYKSTTLAMVKSLNLVEMSAIDVATMPALFRKMP